MCHRSIKSQNSTKNSTSKFASDLEETSALSCSEHCLFCYFNFVKFMLGFFLSWWFFCCKFWLKISRLCKMLILCENQYQYYSISFWPIFAAQVTILCFQGCLGPGQHYRRRSPAARLCDPAGRGAAPPHLHQPRHTHLLPQKRHLGGRQSMQK